MDTAWAEEEPKTLLTLMSLHAICIRTEDMDLRLAEGIICRDIQEQIEAIFCWKIETD